MKDNGDKAETALRKDGFIFPECCLQFKENIEQEYTDNIEVLISYHDIQVITIGIVKINGYIKQSPFFNFYPGKINNEKKYERKKGRYGEDMYGAIGIPSNGLSGDDYDEYAQYVFNNHLREFYDAILFTFVETFYVMGKIMHEVSTSRREIRKKKALIPRKYSREHRISTEKNKIYLLDDLIKYDSDNYVGSYTHHEMTCPCWEVRGHYRHYKSGKIVFIPAYRKGKDRDKTQPEGKEYFL